ncbi:ADAM22 (predicted) [Pycnogonum litorale]
MQIFSIGLIYTLFLSVLSSHLPGDLDDDIDDWTDDLRPVGEVGRLIQKFPENDKLVKQVPSRYYEIIYPVQVRHHQKLGISTRDANDRSGKHFSQTSLLIKAFNHKLRLELQLNTFLLAPQLIQKHFLPGDAQQISSQEIEHCYYHGKIKDHPGGKAAFRTCNGVSGVIHLGNETFVIHPFRGGDLSRKHPHVIYRARTKRKQQCGNSAQHEWSYGHYRRHKYKHKLKRSATVANIRSKRDVREVTKYIELALILDKRLFQMRNGSRLDVINDAIQICNIADMYLDDLKTKLSVLYVETWATNDQMTVSPNVAETLLNFVDYMSRKAHKVRSDNSQLLTGRQFKGGDVGMAFSDTICTISSVGVVEDSSLYEPHLAGVTMAHNIGHNVGIRHQDNCDCRDSHGCIMNETILGVQNMQPYSFSDCSLKSYINTLRSGNAICLFNKPNQLTHFNSCGNNVVEDDEECDCGGLKDCTDKCCDSITCRLTKEAACASGPCCVDCQLRRPGYTCRIADGECDIPEFCDGKSGECPTNLHKKNGYTCDNDRGYCYDGKCPTGNNRCSEVWGYDSVASEANCYEQFNTQGTLSGNCGRDENNNLIKCSPQNIMCGTLHCQRGGLMPIIEGMNHYSITLVAINRDEYECKVASGNQTDSNANTGLVTVGSRCDENMICVDNKCQDLELFVGEGQCKTNNVAHICSGNGVCSNNNTCFCDEGWLGDDCSIRITSETGPTGTTEAILPPQSTTITHHDKQKETFGVVPLILVFVTVVAGVFIFFALVALCYRRKTSRPIKNGPYSINHQTDGLKMNNGKDDTETSLENAAARGIKFGNMPSYRQERDDKMVEMKRQRMRQHRHGSRESGDDTTHDDETVSFIELAPNNLSKLPEKGILKHNLDGSKSDKSKWLDEPSESDNQEVCSQSDNNRGSDVLTDVEQTLKSLTGYHEDILEALRNAANHGETCHSSLSDELRKSLLSSDGLSDFDASNLFKSSSENLQGSSEDIAAIASAADSVPPCGPIRIRNLEDLIRQLERHHNMQSSSGRHVSPSGSEDIRMSETEADRHYHTLDGRGSNVLSRDNDKQGPSRGLHFKFGGFKNKRQRIPSGCASGTSHSDQPTQSTSSEAASSSHGATTTYLDEESENDDEGNFLDEQLMRSASEEAFPISMKPHYSYERNMNFKQPHQKTLKLDSGGDYFPSPPSESSYASSATQDNGPFPPPPPPPPHITGSSSKVSSRTNTSCSKAPLNSSSKSTPSTTGAKGKHKKKFAEYKH